MSFSETSAMHLDQSDGDALIEDDGVLDLDEAREVIPTNYEITAYGADYPVDALVSRLKSGDIRVPTFGSIDPEKPDQVGFQRDFVWTKTQCDRFIESLLLGLPVPGIFLVKQDTGVLLVLDGHQRLRTLQTFYDGILAGREFRLSRVQERFAGSRYKDLSPEDRRRLDNSILHATVVRQDHPADDDSSVYQIFERLNSGGTVLQPQEIRVALYSGSFVTLLVELNLDEAWRELFGKPSKRLKDMELILRFLALFYFDGSYKRPMKGFLNNYMAGNRDLEIQSASEIRDLFLETTSAVLSSIGPKAFKPKTAVNAAVLDSVMVGVARRLTSGPVVSKDAMRAAFSGLMEQPDYLEAISKATADEEQVATRIRLATAAFAAAE